MLFKWETCKVLKKERALSIEFLIVDLSKFLFITCLSFILLGVKFGLQFCMARRLAGSLGCTEDCKVKFSKLARGAGFSEGAFSVLVLWDFSKLYFAWI